MGDATDLAEAINSIRSILGSDPEAIVLRNDRLSLKQAVLLAFECEFGDKTFTSIAKRVGWTRSRLSKLFKSSSLQPSTIGTIVFALSTEEFRELIVRAYIDHELERRPIAHATLTNTNDPEELARIVWSMVSSGQYWHASVLLAYRRKIHPPQDEDLRRVIEDLSFGVACHSRSFHVALCVSLEIINGCKNINDPFREAFGHMLRAFVLVSLQPPRLSDAEEALSQATSLISNTKSAPRENVLYGEATPGEIQSLDMEIRRVKGQIFRDEHQIESEYSHLIELAAASTDQFEKSRFLTLAAAKLIELGSPMFALMHLKSAHRYTSDFHWRVKQLVLMASAKVQEGELLAATAILRSVDYSYARWMSPFQATADNDLTVVENQLFMKQK